MRGIRLKSMRQSITGDIKAIKPPRLRNSDIAAMEPETLNSLGMEAKSFEPLFSLGSSLLSICLER